MVFNSDDAIKRVTTELREEILLEQLHLDNTLTYRPMPHPQGGQYPTWRVCLEPVYNSRSPLGVDVNGEIILGRVEDTPDTLMVFDADDAERLGVSRHHAMLRPTENKLYILDLNSTNGTWLNGRSIGVNMPYSLSDGDIVRLGQMELVVKIVKRPYGSSSSNVIGDLGDVLPAIAKAIMTQLELKDVLKQAIEMVMHYTPADEVTVWLVDEQTGELFLEAGQGMSEGQIMRLPVNNTMAGKVIKGGKPLRANRADDGEQIKLKTGYLVEGVIYVPLTLGGVTFGVLSAVHRDNGKSFSSVNEKMMLAIADLTAAAVQNARVFQATQRGSNHRAKVVTALNYALSYDLKTVVNSIVGYAGMLQNSSTQDDESREITGSIVEVAGQMSRLVNQLIEITTLTQDITMRHHAPCDLVEVATRAVEDSQAAATNKAIAIDFQVMGEPVMMVGDARYLYRSILNLLDNAIKFSPEGSPIAVTLMFWHNEVIIRVRDSGTGIPEDDLPHLFDGYLRSKPSTDGKTGMGLGLEVVRATVEAHRGTVTARNAEDHGAEFVITLPGSLSVK